MIGGEGEVVADFDGRGWILFQGENWKASSQTPLQRGQKVIVTAVNGLELSVVATSETRHEGD
jgi:membrane-bound serine protease (ClpP class)